MRTKRIKLNIILKALLLILNIILVITIYGLNLELKEIKTELNKKVEQLEKIGFGIVLNNCPDCKSEVMVDMVNDEFYYIKCGKCNLFCGYYTNSSKEILFEKWNNCDLENTEE
jgi:hypothetical protein